ncbi:holin/anti-holin protein [Yersinia phage vB_YenM_P744]
MPELFYGSEVNMDTSSTLVQLFQMYHRQLGYGVIAAILAVLRHKHNGATAGVYAFDAACCMFLAAGADQLLELFSLPAKYGYMTSVFIGVFGWQVIWNLIKARIPIKGVKSETN